MSIGDKPAKQSGISFLSSCLSARTCSTPSWQIYRLPVAIAHCTVICATMSIILCCVWLVGPEKAVSSHYVILIIHQGMPYYNAPIFKPLKTSAQSTTSNRVPHPSGSKANWSYPNPAVIISDTYSNHCIFSVDYHYYGFVSMDGLAVKRSIFTLFWALEFVAVINQL